MPLNPVRQVLDNGAVVIAEENHTTPAVTLLAVIRAGGCDDPEGKDGTAALLARVLDRGTLSRSANVIADDLDGRGASLSVSAGRHQIGVAAACLVEDFGPVLAIAADVLRSPALPEPDIATRRAEILTSIRQEDDDPASVATNRFMEQLYGRHPYARRVRGTAETVAAIERTDLRAFHERWFRPAALTVVVVGSLPAATLVNHVATAFGDWAGDGPRRVLEVADADPPAGRTLDRIGMPDKAQADVAYGFVGVRRLDPRYMAASVMNNALGQYALGGRLGDSIRERQGMAYYCFSSLDANVVRGPLTIRAGVNPANVDRAIASIDEEIARMAADGPTDKEVGESKQYLIGSMPRMLETNQGIANFLQTAEFFKLGLDYDLRLPGLLQAVNRDAVHEAARRVLDPSRAAVVIAGPYDPPAQ
jgi:zinc protease